MLAERTATNETVAIKVIKKEEIVQNDDYECARVEKSVLSAANLSPFITRLYSTFQTEVFLIFLKVAHGWMTPIYIYMYTNG